MPVGTDPRNRTAQGLRCAGPGRLAAIGLLAACVLIAASSQTMAQRYGGGRGPGGDTGGGSTSTGNAGPAAGAASRGGSETEWRRPGARFGGLGGARPRRPWADGPVSGYGGWRRDAGGPWGWPRRPRPPVWEGEPYGAGPAAPRDYERLPAEAVNPYGDPEWDGPRGPGPQPRRPWRRAAAPAGTGGPPVGRRQQVAAPQPPRLATTRPAQTGPAPVRAATRVDSVPDEVLVELRPNLPGNAPDLLASRFGLTRLGAERIDLIDSTVYRFRLARGRQPGSVIAALRQDGTVAFAQQNGKFRLQAAPQTPAATGSPSLQWSADKLRLGEVHRLSTGARIVIAMIDSGIDIAHPELGGGHIRLLDALDTPFAPHDHGTAIAGALVSRGQLTGVAPDAEVLGIRTFDSKANAIGAEGTSIHIAKALDLADREKARVFNLSFAGPADDLLTRMLAALRRKGDVIVAAAGNAGPQSPPLFPADDPDVIAVTATDAKDALYGFANRGSYVCISAPGVDVLEPAPDSSYQLTSGTSLAAAHVSGIAALLLSRDPSLDEAAVRKALVETADAVAAGGTSEEFGSGLVDAVKAVHRFDPVAPAVTNVAAPAATPEPAASAAEAGAASAAQQP